MECVRSHIVDQDILDLIQLWLPYGRRRSARRSNQPKGISLGAVVSPLLCNIYLHQLDLALQRNRLPLVRYADDFVVLCDCAERRDEALRVVRDTLNTIKLELNTGKTRLTSFEEGFTFLGVTFKGQKYWYKRRGVRLEASGRAEGFPIQVDGYW